MGLHYDDWHHAAWDREARINRELRDTARAQFRPLLIDLYEAKSGDEFADRFLAALEHWRRHRKDLEG